MGADLRIMDALVLIFDVRMDRNQDVILEQIFKSNDRRPLKESGIQGEGQRDRSLCGWS